METFKVAHLREQGQDMVIVIVGPAFASMSSKDQDDGMNVLQICAESAGLAGLVVPVWREGNRAKFIAPLNWHPFFQSLTWDRILSSVNRELHCG